MDTVQENTELQEKLKTSSERLEEYQVEVDELTD